MDNFDKLSALSQQLHALLLHAYGEGGEVFRRMRGDTQDAYLWACSDIAGEIKGLVEIVAGESSTQGVCNG